MRPLARQTLLWSTWRTWAKTSTTRSYCVLIWCIFSLQTKNVPSTIIWARTIGMCGMGVGSQLGWQWRRSSYTSKQICWSVCDKYISTWKMFRRRAQHSKRIQGWSLSRSSWKNLRTVRRWKNHQGIDHFLFQGSDIRFESQIISVGELHHWSRYQFVPQRQTVWSYQQVQSHPNPWEVAKGSYMHWSRSCPP